MRITFLVITGSNAASVALKKRYEGGERSLRREMEDHAKARDRVERGKLLKRGMLVAHVARESAFVLEARIERC